MPAELFTGKFQEVLDSCELGNLRGVLVVRSQLTADILEALGWRGEDWLAQAAGAVLLDNQMPKSMQTSSSGVPQTVTSDAGAASRRTAVAWPAVKRALLGAGLGLIVAAVWLVRSRKARKLTRRAPAG